jgi:hypothetical protein
MNNLMPIGTTDVCRAVLQIKQNPHLWNQFPERTQNETSPHHEVDDIWIRARDRKDLGDSWAEYIEGVYDSVWYPAAQELPAVKDLCLDLMATVRGEKLGICLITRIPPGGKVLPHTDPGYNAREFEKYVIQLEGHPDQAFCFAEGSYSAQSGEVYWFRNTVEHWVENNSAVDRISLIVSVMKDRRMVCQQDL